MYKFKIPLFLLILLAVALSCKVSDRATRQSVMEDTRDETPNILFLNFVIYAGSNPGDYSVKFMNKIIAPGRLKDGANIPYSPQPNDMEYLVTGALSQVLQRGFIANPLLQTFEFVDDDGFLAKKDVQLDSTMFSLRMQLEPGGSAISLERYNGPDAGNTQLLVVELDMGGQR